MKRTSLPLLTRREFITLLGGAAARGRSRRARSRRARCGASACSWSSAADDPEGQARIAAFVQGLQQLGWTVGRNVRIDIRWGAGDADSMRKIRGGIGRARAGRHPGRWQPGRGGACNRRPAPCRSCSRSSPIRSAPASSRAWRGRAATPPASRVRIRPEREMAGAAQADRAGHDASGGPSGSRDNRRNRPVRRNPGRGAVARSGGEPRQCARRRARSSDAIAAFARVRMAA